MPSHCDQGFLIETDEQIIACIYSYNISHFFNTRNYDLSNWLATPEMIDFYGMYPYWSNMGTGSEYAWPYAVNESFGYIPGNGCVLLTAPHAQKHYRNDADDSDHAYPYGKPSDTCTGSVAMVLHYVTGAPIVFTQYAHDDPNWYHDVHDAYFQTPWYTPTSWITSSSPRRIPMKKFIEEHQDLLSPNQIQVDLDIHGAAASHNWNIDIGVGNCYTSGIGDGCSLVTDYGLTIPYMIQETMEAWNIPDVEYPHHTFSGMGQPTMTQFISQYLGINTLQLEISRDYRCDNDDANDVNLIRGLAEVINNINSDLGCGSAPIPGDCNNDGEINVTDIVSIIWAILNDFAGCCDIDPNSGDDCLDCSNCDVNGDGVINILDVVIVIDLILRDTGTSSEDRELVITIKQKLQKSLKYNSRSKEKKALSESLTLLRKKGIKNNFNLDRMVIKNDINIVIKMIKNKKEINIILTKIESFLNGDVEFMGDKNILFKLQECLSKVNHTKNKKDKVLKEAQNILRMGGYSTLPRTGSNRIIDTPSSKNQIEKNKSFLLSGMVLDGTTTSGRDTKKNK